MKIKVKKFTKNLTSLMRSVGYTPDQKESGEPSFSRRITDQAFPRFHVYVSERDEKWILKLHLDQRRPTYGDQTAHGGEYDGPVVEKEVDRVKRGIYEFWKKKKRSEDKDRKKKPQNSKKIIFWAVFLVVASLIVWFLFF